MVDFLAMNIKNQMFKVVLHLRRLGNCAWGWSDGFSWRLYETKNSLSIERQNQQEPAGAVQLNFGKATVHLSKSIYYDIDSKVLHRVKRFAVGSAGQLSSTACNSRKKYPEYWNDVETEISPQLFNVCPSSEEYKMVERCFLKSCLHRRIVQIQRLQNRNLWDGFISKKESMDLRRGKKSNEMRLFHGTDSNTISKINVNGFNRNFVSTHIWGKGIYFARDAKYSCDDRYSKPDRDGTKRMYLARVLVGEYCIGDGKDLAPSRARSGASDPHDLCDSTVDKNDPPQIFVTYNDFQQYPEHIITFR
jgi:hypothetical protein